VGIIAINLGAALVLQRLRETPERLRKLQKGALAALGVWFLAGGWITYVHFRRSPELATEPYPFLNEARVRKGLAPTEDGLSRDPLEVVREKRRRGMRLKAEELRLLESQGHGTSQ